MSSNTRRGSGQKGDGGEKGGQRPSGDDNKASGQGDQLRLADKFRDRFRGNITDDAPPVRPEFDPPVERPEPVAHLDAQPAGASAGQPAGPHAGSPHDPPAADPRADHAAAIPESVAKPGEPQGAQKTANFASTLIGVLAPIVVRDPRPVAGPNADGRGSAAGMLVGASGVIVSSGPRTGDGAGSESVAAETVAPGLAAPELAAPESVDRSEPTRADPLVTARVALASMDTVEEPRSTPGDMASPWYEQPPVDTDPIYDRPPPNIVVRVAIGTATAALLAIVIFAFARWRMRDVTDEAAATDTATGRSDPARPFSLTGNDRAAAAPPSDLGGTVAPSSAGAPAPEAAPPIAREPVVAPPVVAPVEGLREPGPSPSAPLLGLLPKIRPPVQARHPLTGSPPIERVGTAIVNRGIAAGAASNPDNVARRVPPTGASPVAPILGDDVGTPAPRNDTTSTRTTPPPPPSTDVVAAPAKPPVAPTTTAAAADKTKSKPTYDPDSTLPLNVE